MAVLNKIRQRSVFLIIIIALALFAFVLADVIRNGGATTQKSQAVIAEVNDEEIDREEFARDVEAFQRNMGANASTAQAVNQVWDMKLREVLLKEQFEELGIDVGEAQVRAALREQLGTNPQFTNQAGNFDESRLQEYVANIRATSPEAYQQWVAYENSIAESARESIYYSLIRAGIGATNFEGEQAYRLENDNVDLRYVQIPYSTIPDSEVNVSKDEIRDYIKKHKNKFQTEEARDIQYVFFPEEASAEDESEAKEAIEDIVGNFRNADTDELIDFVNRNSDLPYQDRYYFEDQVSGDFGAQLFNLEQGELYGPYKEGGYWKVSRLIESRQIADSAKASHIMISWEGGPTGVTTSRTKEEASALADSIAGVVRRDVSEFTALAGQFSDDQATSGAGGGLGDFGPGQMIPAFNDFIFDENAAEGDIGVVESELGYHVIHIEEKSDEERAVKIATVARGIEPSEESLNALYTEVTKFEIAAKNEGLTEVAKTENREIRTVKDLKPLDENIPGVGTQRRIVQWAFEDDVEAGDINRFEVPTGYVIAQVTAVKEEGLMSAEDAASTVEPILIKEKKAEIIKERITSNSLADIASNFNAEVQTASAVNRANPTLAGAGREPKVVGALFALEPGDVSKPIAGDRGVYVAELTSFNEAPAQESYRNYVQQETSQRRGEVESRVFEALKENAKIKDKRADFY